jgi:hypothetical protein
MRIVLILLLVGTNLVNASEALRKKVKRTGERLDENKKTYENELMKLSQKKICLKLVRDQTGTSKNYIDTLPKDLLQICESYLIPTESLNLMQTNKRNGRLTITGFHNIFKNNGNIQVYRNVQIQNEIKWDDPQNFIPDSLKLSIKNCLRRPENQRSSCIYDEVLYWNWRTTNSNIYQLYMKILFKVLEKVYVETASKERLVKKDIERDIFKTASYFAGNGDITALEDVRKIVAILKNNGELNETFFGWGQTALMCAARDGCVESVKILLKAKANVEVKVKDGETAFLKSVKGGHLAVVKILLEAKADVDVKGFGGKTAVMYAAMYGHVEILKLLLKANANVDARGTYGETAIMRAASEGHIETVNILLEAKANIENKDDFSGRTAAQIAKAYGFKSIERAINQFAKENSELKK